MLLTIKERRNVVVYKRAYTALRLSHAAMLRGESNDYVAHYALETARSEASEALPQPLVTAIELSIDKAFGWALDESTEDAVSRAVNE